MDLAVPVQPLSRVLLYPTHGPGSHFSPVTVALAALVLPAALLLDGVVGQALAGIPWRHPSTCWGGRQHIWTRLYFKWNSCQTPAGFGMSIKLVIGNYFNVIFVMFWKWKLSICNSVCQEGNWHILPSWSSMPATKHIHRAPTQIYRVPTLISAFLLWTSCFAEFDHGYCVLYCWNALGQVAQGVCWAQRSM